MSRVKPTSRPVLLPTSHCLFADVIVGKFPRNTSKVLPESRTSSRKVTVCFLPHFAENPVLSVSGNNRYLQRILMVLGSGLCKEVKKVRAPVFKLIRSPSLSDKHVGVAPFGHSEACKLVTAEQASDPYVAVPLRAIFFAVLRSLCTCQSPACFGNYLVCAGVESTKLHLAMISEEDKSDWKPERDIRTFPTNAFGKIEFVKEGLGGRKPAKVSADKRKGNSRRTTLHIVFLFRRIPCENCMVWAYCGVFLSVREAC